MANPTTDATFQADTAEGVTLVDFYADWCGPCQALAPKIDEVATEMEGKAKVLKLNVDDNPETAQNFGVMSIPTLLVFKDGEMVDKAVGVSEKDELVNLIESHL